jgi:hypothetical protein
VTKVKSQSVILQVLGRGPVRFELPSRILRFFRAIPAAFDLHQGARGPE